MKNFIIFFNEKEGSSPLVRLLDNFAQISIIHLVNRKGWEPFDYHHCGAMALPDLFECLDIIYGYKEASFEELNKIYRKTAARPLERFDQSLSVGFKMRFKPPMTSWRRRIARMSREMSREVAESPLGQCLLLAGPYRAKFRKLMLESIKRNNLVVFLTARQDVLRLGLSKYHGDGTGGRGHLQFKLASGEISHEDIGRIHVDVGKLETIIDQCERMHGEKRDLMTELEAQGTRVVPLLYEDFVADKVAFFKRFGEAIDLTLSEAEIREVAGTWSNFKKVHSDDISSFVENDREVMDQLGSRYVPWEEGAYR